jgi:hypothetical protein
MRETSLLILTLLLTAFTSTPAQAQDQQLYVVPDGAETRWSSFENPKAAKGQGGAENKTAKGHAFEIVPPGQTRVLLNVTGAGLIQRIWLTISNRTPEVLRSARIEMYWDGAAKPAVSVPLGDLFWLRPWPPASFSECFIQRPRRPLLHLLYPHAIPQSRANYFHQR